MPALDTSRAPRLLPLLLAALTMSGCAPVVCPFPAECRMRDPTPHDALSAVAQSYWDLRLAADPLEATEIGDHRFDDQVPDESPEGRAKHREVLRRLAAAVAKIEPGRLGGRDR